MAQKIKTEKEQKEQELSKKKERMPFMQVDKQSDPISNFISNFKRQFKNTKGLGLERLFGGKRKEQPKGTTEPESIIGETKTVFSKQLNNRMEAGSVTTYKKNSNSIKVKPDVLGKPNKPKLKL